MARILIVDDAAFMRMMLKDTPTRVDSRLQARLLTEMRQLQSTMSSSLIL